MLKAIKKSMQKAVYVFLFTNLFVLCSYTSGEDCYQEYEKLMHYYQDYDYDNFHMVYSSLLATNGTEGPVLNNEVSKSKSKIKFVNQYMEMYQDERHILMVSRDKKQIVIQNIKKQNKIDMKTLGSWQHVDTLKKYYKPLQCSKQSHYKEMSAELKDEYLNKSIIKRMVFVYEPQSGKLVKSIIESEQLGSFRKETTNIIKFKSGGVSDPFVGSVSSLIESNSKWKEKYSTYKIIDLRSK